jgi:hypothetical protein
VTATSPFDAVEPTTTITAECPSGKQVVGGGFKSVGDAEVVTATESAPVTNIDVKRTGWRVSAFKDAADGGDLQIEAHAICASI